MSTSALPSSPQKCNHCGNDARNHCTGCKDDPQADEADGQCVRTYYCDASCQQADWVIHKSDCLRIQVRKNVYRVGDLLQHMFYIFREVDFDGPIEKVEEKDGNLEVYFNPPGNATLHSAMRSGFHECYKFLQDSWPFPEDLAVSPEDKLGILTLQACDDSIACTHDLAKYFLAGLCTEISEVYVIPKNHKRQIISIDRDGLHDSEMYKHIVLQLTLVRGGGSYIIDLSGAQFGYFQPVAPLAEYMMNRVAVIQQTKNFGYARIYARESLVEAENNIIRLRWTVTVEACPHLLSGAKRWMADAGITVKFLLKMNDRAYEHTKKCMLEHAVINLRGFLKHMGDHLVGKYRIRGDPQVSGQRTSI